MYLRPFYPRIRQSPKNRQNEFMSFLHASFYRLFLDASALRAGLPFLEFPRKGAYTFRFCQRPCFRRPLPQARGQFGIPEYACSIISVPTHSLSASKWLSASSSWSSCSGEWAVSTTGIPPTWWPSSTAIPFWSSSLSRPTAMRRNRSCATIPALPASSSRSSIWAARCCAT